MGRDFSEIRLTVGHFDDPFADVDGYLRTLDAVRRTRHRQINTGPLARHPDPAGLVKRLGDEVIPRFAAV